MADSGNCFHTAGVTGSIPVPPTRTKSATYRVSPSADFAPYGRQYGKTPHKTAGFAVLIAAAVGHLAYESANGADKARARPADVQTAVVDPACIWQPDIRTAAVAALLQAGKADKRHEFGGVIYQNAAGEYCYSAPIAGERHSFAVATDPRGGKLAGIYHTHPGESTASADDLAVVSKLGVPSFIRDKRKTGVSVYRPGLDSRAEFINRPMIESLLRAARSSEAVADANAAAAEARSYSK